MLQTLLISDLYTMFAVHWYTYLWIHTNRMGKCNFFVFPRPYRNCFSRRINALVFRNQKLTNQNGHWHGDARFSCLENIDLPLRCYCRHCLFYRDHPIFSCNVTFETCSKTKLKTGQIQGSQVFEILGSKHSLI